MDFEKLLNVLVSSCKRKTADITVFDDALAVLTDYKNIDPIKEREFARTIREIAAIRVLQFAQAKEFDKADLVQSRVEDFLRLNADIDFDAYCLFMEWSRAPEKRFYQPRRRVLFPKVVAHLQDLADDKLDALSISMPPRTAKSTTCIFFLTWIMGRNPERANVMSGHSDKLTKGFHLEALSIISDSSTYRFAEVFPDSPLVDKSMADETISLKRKSRFPSLTCRSIEGTLTGAVEVGRDALLYMDDLVADREEALNADRMDKLFAIYLNQLKDRMNDGAKQLFVGTRWTPNDPIGRLEEMYAGNDRYRFVGVPALDENGNSNFIYDYNLGFSTEYYEDMKMSLIAAGEEDSWAAKYMCAPYTREGLMFAEDELKYYSELPEGEPDVIFAVCDTKDRGKDYCVQPIVYVYGNDHYVESVICDNSLPEVFEPRLVAALVKHKVSIVRYESNSAGGRLADDVEKKAKDLGWYGKMKKKYSTENKETRILADSLWIKERCFFKETFPDKDYTLFMRQLTHYTITGKNKNDDAPDAMSMYKRLAVSVQGATVKAIKRPF